MRLFFLPFFQDCLQFGAICCNHFLFQFGCLDDHRHLIVIRTDKGLATLEACDRADLCAGQLQSLLHILGFVRLQVQNDLVFGIVYDSAAILTVLQTKEV